MFCLENFEPDRVASSPCGNRTHLSALKERYPWPIDERASIQEWAEGRANPRLPGFNRPLNRLREPPMPRTQQKSPVFSSHRARDSTRGMSVAGRHVRKGWSDSGLADGSADRIAFWQPGM